MQKFDKIKFRNNMSAATRQIVVSLLAVVVALAISMIVIAAMGVNPWRAMVKCSAVHWGIKMRLRKHW